MTKNRINSTPKHNLADATSGNEIHVINIALRSTNLVDLPEDKKDLEKIAWILSPRISKNNLYSELNVRVINTISDDPYFAQILTFSIVGHFVKDDDVSDESFVDFGRDYSLSILWPYAREYANDVFQRTGVPCELLPIINAQTTTEEMVEAGKIKVEIEENQ
jgi:preprotein translocase subunit SecB